MRIAIIGSSGSGKSTLGRALGHRLGVPWVELDALNWETGWRDLSRTDPERLTRRVEAAIAGPCWVTDGNYRLALPLILARATDVIWLDFSRWVIMNRVIRRSALRAMSGRELWPGTGNTETWRRWLDKDHPIRWAWDTYDGRRLRYAELFADPRLAGVNRHRLGRPSEVRSLIESLASKAQPAL